MNAVQTLPEMKVLHNILLQKGVEANYNNERIKEFFGLFQRGNFFNDWKCKGNFLGSVLTCIKLHDPEYHIDTIFQLTNIHNIIWKETVAE
jgi:hypothetical protein